MATSNFIDMTGIQIGIKKEIELMKDQINK